ncbi:MAG: hypothetical protein FWD68_16325 [Alphaproteobacteria bacterium]|nr:hypothetical protein [Alphaproteobacteria bacterium]
MSKSHTGPVFISARPSAAISLRTIFALGAALSLASCVTGGNGAVETRPNRPPTHGYAQLTIVTAQSGGLFTALADANCTISNRDFSSLFKTPASVKVPLYGYSTQPVRISCSKPGYSTNSVVLTPVDADVVASIQSRASAGAIAGSAMSLIPVVGGVAGAVGQAAGANIGAQAAAQEAAKLTDAERRAHNYSYFPALAANDDDRVVRVVLTKTGG